MRLLIPALLLAAGAVSAAAQPAASPLEFLGLRPGMPRAELATVLTDLGGALRCQSTSEPRIHACDGTIPDPDAGALRVTVSLVDGHLGVALVAAPLAAEQISDWHDQLSRRYGDVAPRRSPGQESFQWIRDRRMIRLTVRRETTGLQASVSLVDGRLLDGLPPP